MAAGESYPYLVKDSTGQERESGTLTFTDSNNQPSPGGSAIGVASAFAPTGLTGATSVTRYVGGVATVAPTTGTFAIGDYVISRNGKIFVCTVAGTPGTWIEPASITFAPLASPTFTGTVTVPAAAAVTSAPKLADLSSYLTIASGALPNTGAWTSTTAKQNPVARQITVNVEFVTDGTNALATCAIAISSDNSTYTTIGTLSLAQALNNVGAVKFVCPVNLPNAWWIKLTFAQGTVAASIYYQRRVTTIFDEVSRDGHPAHLPLPAGYPLNATSPALAKFIRAKTGIGKLFGFTVTSTNVAAQFVLLFDATELPAEGAVPLAAFNVAAASPAGGYWGSVGRAFMHGIILCNSTTQGTKTLGAADCIFDVQYV